MGIFSNPLAVSFKAYVDFPNGQKNKLISLKIWDNDVFALYFRLRNQGWIFKALFVQDSNNQNHKLDLIKYETAYKILSPDQKLFYNQKYDKYGNPYIPKK